jgi:hypothetical protein
VFPEVHAVLQELLRGDALTLYLLLDEWSSLPRDVQPYLAEFMRRSFIPNPYLCVKIAALEYRSSFSIPLEKGEYIGFELGSDIAASLDLDEYYVFDKNPEKLTEEFSRILYLHIKSELAADLLEDTYNVKSSADLTRTLFTDREIFAELVRASEGIARDLINIFTRAYFQAQKQDRLKIDKKTVLEAARQWFEQDKQQGLSDSLQAALNRILEEVIAKKKTRSFMASRQLERNDVLQGLSDARVLHLILRGYADKENPGKRYNIYTLDYGTYVDLLATKSAPQGFIEIVGNVDLANFAVPFDDQRSIRRVIVSEEILEPPPTT